MIPQADHLVADYLERLNGELADLPPDRRRELVQDISGHIAEARADLPTESEAELRTLLDRLGDPTEIAAEARERFGVKPRRRGAIEVVTLVLLLVGGVVIPVVGWLVGVVLLWVSEVWTTREKLIGTLVVPGGLALPLFLGAFSSGAGACVQEGASGTVTCTGGPSDAVQVLGLILIVLLVLAPFATTMYLARRMTRGSPPLAA